MHLAIILSFWAEWHTKLLHRSIAFFAYWFVQITDANGTRRDKDYVPVDERKPLKASQICCIPSLPQSNTIISRGFDSNKGLLIFQGQCILNWAAHCWLIEQQRCRESGIRGEFNRNGAIGMVWRTGQQLKPTSMSTDSGQSWLPFLYCLTWSASAISYNARRSKLFSGHCCDSRVSKDSG